VIKLTRKRSFADIPADFRGQKLAHKHFELLRRYFEATAAARPISFSSAQWKSAKSKLRADTIKKCAYCEVPTAVVAHGDVDHFRPKSTYWWLAYCFDNYVFSCQICNQLFKGDLFPISGPTLGAPQLPSPAPSENVWAKLASTFMVDATVARDSDCIAAWSRERGDLVHPYFEDPEPLFRYDVDVVNEEVWLRATGDERSQRALAASETVLGLNREDLRKLRYDHFATIAVLKLALQGRSLPAASRNGILREFARRQKPQFPFAGMHRYFAKHWRIPTQ
jgi:hypothetical protein